MLDRLTGMNVFVRAAKVGSLSGAARQLSLSAAMATKHLDALERRLGARLFQRSTRKLSLTEPGRQYLQALTRLLPDLEEIEATIASQRVEATGTLRLNAPVSFGVRHIAPLIHVFTEKHRSVIVDLGLNDRYVDLVDEGWDLAIRVGRLKDSRLVSRKLADSAMLICASPTYWSAHGRPNRARELSDHNCLGFTIPTFAGPDEWRFGRDRDLCIPVKGSLRANNGDALTAAAVAGLGVVYQPDFIVGDAIRRGTLESVSLDAMTGDVGGIHLLYSLDHSPPAKARAMINFLLSAFTPKPPWQV
jgi:DNA-binding transcriptional LysR family regulator